MKKSKEDKFCKDCKFGLCEHKWKEKERFIFTKHYYNTEETAKGILILQECSNCGKLKKVYL